LVQNGFSLLLSKKTADQLSCSGLAFEVEGVDSRTDVLNAIQRKKIALVIVTGEINQVQPEGYMVRRTALEHQIPYFTTIAAAEAAIQAILAMRLEMLTFSPVQDYFNPHEKGRFLFRCFSEAVARI